MQIKKGGILVLGVLTIIVLSGFVIYSLMNKKNIEPVSEIEEREKIILKEEVGIPEPQKQSIEEVPGLLIDESKIFTIEIKDTKFYPSEINVPIGTTVIWINKDPSRAYQVYENAPNRKFNSPRLSLNDQYNYTFNEEGLYNFNDAIFRYMKGTITVG